MELERFVISDNEIRTKLADRQGSPLRIAEVYQGELARSIVDKRSDDKRQVPEILVSPPEESGHNSRESRDILVLEKCKSGTNSGEKENFESKYHRSELKESPVRSTYEPKHRYVPPMEPPVSTYKLANEVLESKGNPLRDRSRSKES